MHARISISVAAMAFVALSSAAHASFDGSYKGNAQTTGGTRDFCKGTTPISASVSAGSIAIRVPKSEGGAASVVGKVSGNGSFDARGERFNFKGKIAGKKITGTWKATYCNGPFALNR